VNLSQKNSCQQVLGVFIISVMVCYSTFSVADSADDKPGCSTTGIDYVDQADMTRAERIAEMDQAFLESVHRFDDCTLSKQEPSSDSDLTGESGSSGSSESIAGNEEDSKGGQSGYESTASDEMSGTESESTPVADMGTESVSAEDLDDKPVTFNSASDNGAVPEDIPDANNDDVVAAQIRTAAEIETDPEKKEKLWNEYRRYKGLPVKYDK
jgi:hypothetical protein